MRSLILALKVCAAVSVIIPAVAVSALAQIADAQVDRYLESTLEHALSTKEEALDRWKERYSNLSEGSHDDNIGEEGSLEITESVRSRTVYFWTPTSRCFSRAGLAAVFKMVWGSVRR